MIIYPKMTLLKNYQNTLSKKGIILYTKDGRYDVLNPTDQFVRMLLDGIA